MLGAPGTHCADLKVIFQPGTGKKQNHTKIIIFQPKYCIIDKMQVSSHPNHDNICVPVDCTAHRTYYMLNSLQIWVSKILLTQIWVGVQGRIKFLIWSSGTRVGSCGSNTRHIKPFPALQLKKLLKQNSAYPDLQTILYIICSVCCTVNRNTNIIMVRVAQNLHIVYYIIFRLKQNDFSAILFLARAG